MTPDPHRPATDPTAVPTAAEVVLHEQRLAVSAVRVPTERVVLRRRLVSEVRQVDVTVHREELEVLRLPLDPEPTAVGRDRQDAAAEPLVIVLSEEVPVVQVRTRPYEQITVTVELIAGQQEVHEQISREQAELTESPAGPAPR